MAPELTSEAILANRELWRLDPSAAIFEGLVTPGEIEMVEEANGYRFEYQSAGKAVGLTRARLTLNKSDLHAIDQTLVVTADGQSREYRFIEAAFEKRAATAVPGELFVPDRELLPETSRSRGESKSESVEPTGTSEAVASPELEIEVTYLLNRIKANLGEQVSLSRTAAGALRIEALVENPERKAEILRALLPVQNNPAIRIDVQTVAEAARRQTDQTRNAIVRDVEIPSGVIPADAELRAYFSSRLVGREPIDEEMKRYTSRVMGHSRQALLHAAALKKLVNRFSPGALQALTAEARAKWLAMISEQASSYQREMLTLRQELRKVFSGSDEGSNETLSEADLSRAADRLLALSYSNDEGVRAAFSISTGTRERNPIKSAQFWRSLNSAEKLAGAIQRVYQK
jgi:hypothetical protein